MHSATMFWGQRGRSAEMRNASEILRNAGGENVWDTFARTEADEPSRDRRIFQQKNICDLGGNARGAFGLEKMIEK